MKMISNIFIIQISAAHSITTIIFNSKTMLKLHTKGMNKCHKLIKMTLNISTIQIWVVHSIIMITSKQIRFQNLRWSPSTQMVTTIRLRCQRNGITRIHSGSTNCINHSLWKTREMQMTSRTTTYQTEVETQWECTAK